MVYPVKVKETAYADQFVYDHKRWSAQAPPFTLIMPFWHILVNVKTSSGSPTIIASSTNPFANNWGKYDIEAFNRSYTKMVSSIGSSASFGATLTAERRESFDMLVGLTTNALKAARRIRKLDLLGAAQSLGIPLKIEKSLKVKRRVRVRGSNSKSYKFVNVTKPIYRLPNGRELTKDLASGWLLYSYGMAPLMADCYKAVDALQNNFPIKKIAGHANVPLPNEHNKVVSGPDWSLFTSEGFVSVHQSCKVRVNNPNLFLANQLGLVNPVQWGLEAIPYSFVIDWFSNLSDVLSSFTDFVGLSIFDESVNVKKSYNFSVTVYDTYKEPWNLLSSSTATCFYTSRSTSLVTPTLHFTYERFNWQRGLNAISLLVGFLRK